MSRTDRAEASTYNLLDEPWLPVLDARGQPEEVSLLDVFRRAQGLRQLDGDIPTQTFTQLRLLLAILHRALAPIAPVSVDEVADRILSVRARWSEMVPLVEDYLESHRARFELFSSDQPFFQVADLHARDGSVLPLSKLIVDVPNGAPYLTMRRGAGLDRISPGEATRWLLQVHGYDLSGIKTGTVGHPRAKNGKVYPERVGWCGQIGGLNLVGDNLRETLLLNLWAALADNQEEDLPPWERTPEGVGPGSGAEARPTGPVALYTWQSRRVRLIGDRRGVTGVVLTYGDELVPQQRQSLLRREPMTAWRFSEPQTKAYRFNVFMPRLHRPDAQLWRGLSALLPHAETADDKNRPAGLMEHAARLRWSGMLDDDFIIRVRALGLVYGAQNAAVDDLIDDDLDIPAALLPADRVELRQAALDAVDSAERTVRAYVQLAANLARAVGADQDALDGPRARAREDGYAALDSPYRHWIRDTLPREIDDPTRADRTWQRTVRRVVLSLGAQLVRQSPPAAWVGREDDNGLRLDVGRSEVWFRAALARALPKASAESAPGPSAPAPAQEVS